MQRGPHRRAHPGGASSRPVQVGGVTVSRATLHNEDELRRKDVRGSATTCFVRRAGDVIPEIVKVIDRSAHRRPSRSSSSPSTARCAARPAVKDEDGAIIRCTGLDLPRPARRRGLRHFASRGGMDIEGWGTSWPSSWSSRGR